jgi:hypothetical protein
MCCVVSPVMCDSSSLWWLSCTVVSESRLHRPLPPPPPPPLTADCINGSVRVCSCVVVVSRGKFKRTLDGYCGLCILALYFLYLTVVKGALSVFDCSVNQDGVYILDADPSIRCNEVGSPPLGVSPWTQPNIRARQCHHSHPPPLRVTCFTTRGASSPCMPAAQSVTPFLETSSLPGSSIVDISSSNRPHARVTLGCSHLIPL